MYVKSKEINANIKEGKCKQSMKLDQEWKVRDKRTKQLNTSEKRSVCVCVCQETEHKIKWMFREQRSLNTYKIITINRAQIRREEFNGIIDNRQTMWKLKPEKRSVVKRTQRYKYQIGVRPIDIVSEPGVTTTDKEHRECMIDKTKWELRPEAENNEKHSNVKRGTSQY